MQAQARRSTVAAAVALTLALASGPVFAVELPVPCAVGVCGAPGVNSWVSAGAATLATSGNNLTVTQTTSNATYNWQSFNIGAGGVVRFDQPDETSVALNRIFQADPARILGQLSSNGRVYLLNRNGILFGQGAQVNVRGLVASSLDLSPEALQLGIGRAASLTAPAFQPYTEAGVALASGAVTVEQGASIRADGGQVLIFAPQVTNRGEISTPDGQTILAAGQRIFLVASDSSDLRGLLVEVGDGGTVTNGPDDPNAGGAAALAGRISADRGNVTLAGLAVNQNGRVSATTSIRANGSIRLVARDTQVQRLSDTNVLEFSRNGSLTLGANSVTEVTLDNDPATTVDVNTQPVSTVDLWGHDVSMLRNARITATAGRVTATATTSREGLEAIGATADDSRFTMAAGAAIDVSGATVDLPMERNSLRVELRGSQLADSPVQRDGALRGETVYVDMRQSGFRADGSFWRGTPLADLAGDIATVARDVRERSLNAGSVVIQSQGAVLLDNDATINLAGGRINWQSGYVRSSQLLGADGRVYGMAAADRDRTFTAVLDNQNLNDPRWGIAVRLSLASYDPRGNYEPGYVEGKDAGSLSIVAPRIFAGARINGTVVNGPTQRLPVQVGPSYQPYSAWNVVARGPRLSFGLVDALPAVFIDYALGDVLFGDPEDLDTVRNADGTVFDPRRDPLPAALNVLRLSPTMLRNAAPSALTIAANGSITLPADVDLRLTPGANLSLRAGAIDLQGSVTLPSGSVSARARQTVAYDNSSIALAPMLRLGSTASLSLQGNWVNDRWSIDRGEFLLPPAYINGGSAELTVDDGAAILATGSVIDVSGGAQRRADGVVVAGRGGSIVVGTRQANATVATPLQLGTTLRGFGLREGGSLSVTAPSVCISATACGVAGTLALAPSFFTAGGFRSFSVASNAGDLTVAGNTTLDLRATNWVLSNAAVSAPSGTALSSLVTPTLLPDDQRRSVSLALTANQLSVGSIAYGDLVVEAGARIIGDNGATLNFSTNSRLFFGGNVVAPGGSVGFNLLPTLVMDSYRADQGLWFLTGSSVNVDGRTVLTTRQDGRRVGSVLDGGSIVVDAARGFVAVQTGATWSANGASDRLEIQRDDGLFETLPVASRGGSIQVATTDGMRFDGRLSAQGGAASAAGGSFSLLVDNRRSNDPNGVAPLVARSIVVGTPSAALTAGAAWPIGEAGVASIASSTLASGGFDFISLTARDTVKPINVAGPEILATGSVVLTDGSALTPRARLVIGASTLQVLGNAQLSAAYVALGSNDVVSQQLGTASSGTGALRVDSRLTEFVGQFALAGASQAQFTGLDGIRFTGVFGPAGGDYRANVRFPGDVTFTTPQAYVSTLTQATVAAAGRMAFTATGTQTPLLSAGGSLALSASSIDVATRVAAPGGALTLTAGEVTVAAGGSLSVALDTTTLFGRLQGGFAWVYELPDGSVRVYDGVLSTLPSKDVTLNAGTVRVLPGGVIDASGGGDLLSYEFIPGPGGTRDVLAAGQPEGSFAVVPGLSLPFAPVDPREARGSTLQPGDRVWLDAAAGLPAGEYTLLPARYALMPGAVLVTPVSGFSGLRVGGTGALVDGTPVVAGYRTVAGTPIRDSLTSGFAVRSAASVATLAHYDVASANTFFPAIDSLSGTRLPRDAGSVSLLVGSALDISGVIRTAAASAGRGATIAVAADRLRVSGTPGDVVADWVTLLDSQLSALKADTLLLGGRADRGGARATAVSSAVEITGGAQITARRLVALADGSLAIRSGSQLTAVGGGATAAPLTVTGGGALLALDSVAGAPIQLSAPSLHGTLLVEAGATIATPRGGAATFAAAGSPLLDGQLNLQGAGLRVVADTLTLASGSGASAGSLRADTLASLGLSSLALEAGTRLSLEGSFSAHFGSLSLRTPVIAATAPGSVVEVAADQVSLAGGSSAAAATAGSSRLQFSARDLTLGQGQLTLSGFSDVSLVAARSLGVAGDGALQTTGNLSLAGGLVASENAVDYGFTAGGSFRLTGAPAVGVSAGLGTRIDINAADALLDGTVLLPSGQLRVRTSGDVVVGSHGLLDLAAPMLAIDDVPLALPGGFVSLQTNNGNVRLLNDSVVRLAGSNGGEGGEFRASAVNGIVDLAGAVDAGASGGALRLASSSLSLDMALRIAAHGFTREVELRQLGVGDWTLAADQTLRADRVTLDVEGGSLALNGVVQSDAGDGRIVAVARDRLTLGGTLRAGNAALSADAGALRSSLLLAAGQAIDLRAGSVVDLAGSAAGGNGELRLRLPEARVLTAVAGGGGLRLDSTFNNVAGITVEGYREYSATTIGTTQTAASIANPWYSAALAFVDATQGREAVLGAPTGLPVRFTPGIDVRSAGNLTLAADWNLARWNYLGVAPTVTLRAGGDLLLNRSLSDGFATLTTGNTGFALPAIPADSASYRLVAGSALSAADPLAVLSGTTGNIVLAAGTPGVGTRVGTQRMVRTGNGSIDIAASGSLVLGNQASVIYTAGVRGSGLALTRTLAAGGLAGLAYPERSGDIRIAVGGDVQGAPSTQFYTEWLWKTGARASDPLRPRPTAWSVAFERFEQGVAVFGGGSLTVRADGSVTNLNASLPTIGRQTGSATNVLLNSVAVTGGGNLSVRSLGDIRGGTFYVGRGNGVLAAGGQMASSLQTGFAPILAEGDTRFAALSRRDLQVEAILDPLLLGISRRLGVAASSYFSQYAPNSAARLVSTGGNLRMLADSRPSSLLGLAFPDVLYLEEPVARVAPPTVEAMAPAGDIRVAGSLTLWPSPQGNLQLLAGRNLVVSPQSGGSIEIILSDASVARDLPTPLQPFGSAALPPDIMGTSFTAQTNFYSPTPVHQLDSQPLRMVARDGDILFQAEAPGALSLLFSAKRARFIAGRDIVSLGVRLQHVAAGDVTTIKAGRDIVYPLSRSSDGQINPNVREITLGGPGELQLIAGRDIDLQTSRGVTTEGNLRNPALPSAGANVSLTAGEAGGAPDFDGFITQFLQASTTYDALLFDYLKRFDSTVSVDKTAALARFRTLTRDQQRPLLETVLLRAVRTAGRAAAVSPTSDFTEAYRALTTYFPGSNPEVAAGQANPYQGAVKLYFSRVYTLAGGDVRLLSPGGGINAGLAAPPTAYGIKKSASQLGVVVQGTGSVLALGYGDFQVNESRVIAGNGGDILVWSTRGDIDAGRGAKTAISAPPPIITIDETGQPKVVYPAAFNGSGIQTLATTPGVKPGNVDLFAPRGVVNAGDAGIVAGNLTIAATAVLGASNISVSGTAVGVPVDTGGLGASLAGASNSAAGASKSGGDLAGQESNSNRQSASNQAEAALNFLDVAVVGLGEDVCRPDDLVCLKNQKRN